MDLICAKVGVPGAMVAKLLDVEKDLHAMSRRSSYVLIRPILQVWVLSSTSPIRLVPTTTRSCADGNENQAVGQKSVCSLNVMVDRLMR